MTGESGARAGFSLIDCKSGRLLGDRLDEWFVPASNHKLWISAAALQTLGPRHRWVTRYGVFRDTLWICGGGDPLFGFEDLSRIARRLRRMGRVRFDRIILDDTLFPQESAPAGWMLEDLDAGWAAPIHSLNMEFNRIPFVLDPHVDHPVLNHPFSFVQASADASSLRFSEDGETDFRIRRTGRFCFEISGRVSKDEEEIECAVRPGLSLYRCALRSALKDAGIDAGSMTHAQVPAEWLKHSEAEEYPSRTLAEALRTVNQDSRNLVAEVILRTMGLNGTGAGGVAAGLKAAQAALDRMGIAGPGRMVDGSGLSVYNLSSPSGLAGLLFAMTQRPEFPVFLDSLAEYGKSGTLKKRNVRFPAGWRVCAKTGSLTGVKTLSGYLIYQGQIRFVFSLMAGGLLKEKHGEVLQDEWLLAVTKEAEKESQP
jgi:D-alanyl-D-alanine carboxypeptidase/D-alanyl-D-alanine-endopeptidase (penicillin-binding protein 4)